MKTIEFYEQIETNILQTLLKEYETFLENTELLINRAKNLDIDYEKLEKMSKDYEIDVHLIRMELTKRLWFNLD